MQDEAACELARADPNAFIEYCVRDEEGAPLRQAAHHREWQALLTNHKRVAILGAAELGKTVQLGWRLLWEIGKNPNLVTFLLGHTESEPIKIIGVVRRAIEANPRVQEVFPHLAKGKPWHDAAISVAGRVDETKDYTMTAFGLDSDMLGSRAHKIVAGDLHDRRNSATPAARKKVIDHFDAIAQSRLLPGGTVWLSGNAWHREDVLHVMEGRSSWTFRRYPLLDRENRSIWPERFDAARIAEIRGAVGPIAFARMYLCQALDEETAYFRDEWFRAAERRGLEMGAPWAPGKRLHYQDALTGETYTPRIYVGIDPHSGRSGVRRKTDTTAIVVIAVHPSGAIQILDIAIGRWPTTELLARVRKLVQDYDPIIAVEDNGTQNMFVSIAQGDRFSSAEVQAKLEREARETGAKPSRADMDAALADALTPRVRGVTTGGNKWDSTYGVEGLSIDFEAGRIIAPAVASGTPIAGVAKLWEGLRYFTPADHTEDVVMAFWIAVTAARRWGVGRTARTPKRWA